MNMFWNDEKNLYETFLFHVKQVNINNFTKTIQTIIYPLVFLLLNVNCCDRSNPAGTFF